MQFRGNKIIFDFFRSEKIAWLSSRITAPPSLKMLVEVSKKAS